MKKNLYDTLEKINRLLCLIRQKLVLHFYYHTFLSIDHLLYLVYIFDKLY